MKKRIVSFLMALVMAVSLLPVQVFAEAVDAAAEQPVLEQQQEQQQQQEQKQEEKQEDTPVQEPVQEPQDKAIDSPVLQAAEDEQPTKTTITLDRTGVSSEYDKLLSLPKEQALTCTTKNSTFEITKVYIITSEDDAELKPTSFFTMNFHGFLKIAPESWLKTGKLSDIVGAKVSADDLIKSGLSAADFTTTYPKYYFVGIVGKDDNFGILVQVKNAVELTDEQKKPLTGLLATVTGENEQNWYQSGDRYNAKTKATSEKGFWTEFTAANGPRAQAQKVLDSATTEAEITAAVTALQAAIANLIPTTQVNPTALYEALQSANKLQEEWFTAVTWTPFAAARTAANELLGKLYDADGNAAAINRGPKAEGEEPEGAIHQSDVDAAVTALTEASEKLFDKSSITYYQEKNDKIAAHFPGLIALAETAKQSDYTADSWTAFSAALAAAKAAEKPVTTETRADKDAFTAYKKAFDDLYTQYYCGLTPAGKITVSLTWMDGERARIENLSTGNYGETIRSGILQEVALDGAYSLKDALAKVPETTTVSASLLCRTTKVFINGVYVSQYYSNQNNPESFVLSWINQIKLHPDDQVMVIASMDVPSEALPTIWGGTAELWQYIDSLKTARFTQGRQIEVKAGEPFTLTVQQAAAALGSGYGTEAGAGMALFISDVAESTTGNHPTKTQIRPSGNAVYTDADGSASMTLYREGWYLIAAYDLRKDEKGNIYNGEGEGESYAGTYYSMNTGAAIWVHVNTPDDLSAVKNTLQAELDKVYAAYPESYFKPETWTALKTAYETGTAGIKEATTSGDASDAQQTAIAAIRGYQDATTAENEQNLITFRTALNKLPDDTALITANVKSVVDELINCYEDMSDYQKKLLTGAEKAKYDKIKAFADAHQDYPEAKNYSLKLNVVADTPEATAVLNDMVTYLRENPATQDRGISGGTGTRIKIETPYAFTATIPNRTEVTSVAPLTKVRFVSGIDYAAYFQTREANGVFTTGKGWTISNENLHFTQTTSGYGYQVDSGLTVKIGDTAYEIKSITYQGIDAGSVKSGRMIAYDDTEYLGKDRDYINMRFDNAVQEFVMPYSDVTVTITWAPVNADSSEAIAAAKTAAKADLAAELAKYKHSDKNYTNIKTAHDDGVKAIDKASTLAEITKAKASALSDMRMAASGGYYGAAIPNWGAGDGFDAGQQVGTVTVSVANFTYDDGYYYRPENEKPFLYLENYPLGEKDSVMTVILRALKDNGYSWNGNKGSDKNQGEDYGITYLSSVSKTENGKTYTLGEFDGGGQSGWMGTLNDWFTNYGFTEFSVKNRSLGDGDYISIQYTQDGLGADLGGTWDNSDTTLKALDVEGGKLLTEFVPGEIGGSYEYVLAIKGAGSVQLTPTAANKNYLTKMFLNEKVTSDVEGVSFYKRTQSIPVKDGDVIYIGCGEKAWPSMNKQGTEAREYTGTWYALRVVDVSKGASTVESMIDELPDVSGVKYGNYQLYVNAVAAARASFNALSKEQQKLVDTTELEKLEAAIAQFQAIDEVKDQLDKLPSAGNLTIEDQEAVKAAKDAYDKLTPEQKAELTGLEIDKMGELTTRMDEIIKENPTPTPTPGGNTGNNSSAKNPYQKDNGKDVKSGNTGDTGITLYLGMGLVAVLAGAVIVIRKRKEN